MAVIELVLRSRRVVTPAGVRAASVGIAGGRIAAVGRWHEPPAGAPLEDLGELALLPGAVDTHVHVNDPGRTDWEGFETATRAAAAGGVTTLVDMPLNSIPATTSAAALEAKRAAARGRIAVDVGFWGGVVPGNLAELAVLHEAGALGCKAFLVPSGVEEFPAIDRGELVAAAHEIARLGSVLLVHAEAPELVGSGEGLSAEERRSHTAWERSRPPEAEAAAIGWLAGASAATGALVHVVHVSSGAGIAAVRAAQRAGLPLSAETCPHYLTFASEEIPDGGVEWKCAPPIRGVTEREALWRALDDRTLALVASDHSPSPPATKSGALGDLFAAWGGIASLQVALAATWTGARERGHGLERLAEWTAAAPARLAGLAARKGAIAPGRDADLAVFDPEASFRVDVDSLYHRHPMTPYDGRTLRGVVRRTYLRGRIVFDSGDFAAPTGELLAR
jgi:allantoinase